MGPFESVWTSALLLIDWFGRGLIVLWASIIVGQIRHDRQSRPDRDLVARLADEAERLHGVGAPWIVGAQWNTHRLGRAARARRDKLRGDLLRAIAKELARRAAT